MIRKKRLYLRFEGQVVRIEALNKKKGFDASDYEKRSGMVELLWSEHTRYTRMFAVFKETAWPSHSFKTTPGLLSADRDQHLVLTTKNHIYVFAVDRVYADERGS